MKNQYAIIEVSKEYADAYVDEMPPRILRKYEEIGINVRSYQLKNTVETIGGIGNYGVLWMNSDDNYIYDISEEGAKAERIPAEVKRMMNDNPEKVFYFVLKYTEDQNWIFIKAVDDFEKLKADPDADKYFSCLAGDNFHSVLLGKGEDSVKTHYITQIIDNLYLIRKEQEGQTKALEAIARELSTLNGLVIQQNKEK